MNNFDKNWHQQNWIKDSESAEFKFWTQFFPLISPSTSTTSNCNGENNDHLSEFYRRIEASTMGYINWDFWTLRTPFSSYGEALQQAVHRISEGRSRKLDFSTIQPLAQSVVERRREELQPKSTSHQRQIDAFTSWARILELVKVPQHISTELKEEEEEEEEDDEGGGK